MGFLWTFMGFSRGYSFFAGAAEMLGGLLLVVPQFTTLGSLISLGVFSNVLMLNMFYDVPRKIYTIHLVLICLFLVFPTPSASSICSSSIAGLTPRWNGRC